jgi:hypothetical protein
LKRSRACREAGAEIDQRRHPPETSSEPAKWEVRIKQGTAVDVARSIASLGRSMPASWSVPAFLLFLGSARDLHVEDRPAWVLLLRGIEQVVVGRAVWTIEVTVDLAVAVEGIAGPVDAL